MSTHSNRLLLRCISELRFAGTSLTSLANSSLLYKDYGLGLDAAGIIRRRRSRCKRTQMMACEPPRRAEQLPVSRSPVHQALR